MKVSFRRIVLTGLSISVLLALSFVSMAEDLPEEVLLWDTFEKDKLDMAVWAPSNPAFIYVEDGVLVLDQKACGGDWLGVSTTTQFEDCVISYDWILAEWSGQGDCGGHLRCPGGNGSYRMRWGWGGNTSVNLVDGIAHPPVGAWQAFPGCNSTYPATSKNFRLKVSFTKDEDDLNLIKVKITDLDTGNQIADWLYEDDWYAKGLLQFEAFKYGIVHADNVVVATLDWEDKIFADDFDPETLGGGKVKAVEASGKLSTTWGEIRSR